MNYVYDPAGRREDRRLRQLLLPGARAPRRSSQKTDPKLAGNPLIFPDDATLASCTRYPSLDRPQEREITAEMQKVTGA